AMTVEAQREFEGIERELLVRGADGAPELRALTRDEATLWHDRLAGCAARFRQAVDAWPGNGHARAGWFDALCLQIRFALDRGDLTLAEAQVRRLNAVPGEGTDETFAEAVHATGRNLHLAIAAERKRQAEATRRTRSLRRSAIALAVLAASAIAFGFVNLNAKRELALESQALMFRTAVRGRAEMIGQFILEVERIADQYRREAVWLMSAQEGDLSPAPHTPAGREGFYLDADFYDESLRPPELEAIDGHPVPVSLRYPTVVRAPWVEGIALQAAADADASRLSRLGHLFGQVHRAWGRDLKWSLAGTATGLLIGFPGYGRYADKPTYDPTKRPWYKAAIDA
ncbi:MAG: hypothetical protein KC620_26305, partial [Myxococcales bacterium]|nr:hypothetical protein [Myxococcales bacterium]